MPSLDPLLAQDRRFHRLTTLKPHVPLDPIPLSEALNDPVAVLPHPPRQVRRDAGIKGAVGRSRENVDARQLFHRSS
jgi:hypothetical protein